MSSSIHSVNANSKLAQHVAANKDHSSFPEHDVDYYDRFTRIDAYLNKEIHPTINQGAAASDGGWLTDHGPGHIVTVIRRACDMLFDSASDDCVLTPYECYVLLLAIHFHDVGNVFGRDEHEKKITEVMVRIGSNILGDDSPQKRLVRDIAMAHGGYVNGDSNTIGQLSYEWRVDTTTPRAHVLAGILRFADELADDCTRTKRFLIDQSGVSELLAGSEIYHHYADRLRKVEPSRREGSIKLRFELDVEKDNNLIAKKCQKGSEKKYLLDEIFDRALKMHCEHVYCTKYMQPLVYFNRIDVEIHICSQKYMDVLNTIRFSMQDSAYPKAPRKLALLCPEITGMTGTVLRKKANEYRKTGVYPQ